MRISHIRIAKTRANGNKLIISNRIFCEKWTYSVWNEYPFNIIDFSIYFCEVSEGTRGIFLVFSFGYFDFRCCFVFIEKLSFIIYFFANKFIYGWNISVRVISVSVFCLVFFQCCHFSLYFFVCAIISVCCTLFILILFGILYSLRYSESLISLEHENT